MKRINLVTIFYLSLCSLSFGEKLEQVMTTKEQRNCGLAKLSKSEKSALEEFIIKQLRAAQADGLKQGVSARNRVAGSFKDEEAARAVGWEQESARDYLISENYQEVTCATRTVGNKTYFIIQTNFSTWATDDVPILLPSISEGKYWCKMGISVVTQSIDSILVNGRKYDFGLFADWKELR